MSTVEMVCFATLGMMVLIWFGLVVWVCLRLSNRHPSTYEELGSPMLFWNNSPANGLRIVGFLFSSEIYKLGDQALTRICIFMRVWLVAYTALFVALIAMFSK
jgi:hypothetical protein